MTILQLKYAIMVADAHSMREAATRLYVSQPGLSSAIKDLEKELGIQIFNRVHQGVVTTKEGETFLAYARMAVEQFSVLEQKYLQGKEDKKIFSVSMQHYTFAVNAFMETIKKFDLDAYHYSIRETQTIEVINDVKNFKSEVGILAVNNFNKQTLTKLFKDYHLQFIPLFHSNTYIYLHKNHPLAGREKLSLDDLQEYPCLIFDQGDNKSFYFKEEALSTYEYKKLISTNERATSMEMIIGLNGYAVGLGVLNDSVLNEDEYVSIELEENEVLTLGYLVREKLALSDIAQEYIKELKKITDNIH